MNESYWMSVSKGENYKKLEKDINIENLIIGGGIVGVTCAYLLSKKNSDVIIVEGNKIGQGSSGRNTGKISCQHNIIYSKINNTHDFETAKSYYEINKRGLDLIENIIKENNIDCDYKKDSSYLYTENENYIEEMKEEYEICKNIGIDCVAHQDLDIPFDVKYAIEFKNQASFNPKKYIDELVKICENQNVTIYENTSIIDITKGEICEAKTDKNTIKAKNIIIATHFPWYDAHNLYFIKEKGEQSYLSSSKNKSDLVKGMFLCVEDPTKTFRVHRHKTQEILIAGGYSHKVGQKKKEVEIYKDISNMCKNKFNSDIIKNKWSAQDYISFDYIPYIGKINKNIDNIYVATGFGKWGMTNGTASAILISDMILYPHIESKYSKIFNPHRKNPYFTPEFLKENINVGIEYIKGKVELGNDEFPIEKGSSTVVMIDGKRYGAYRHFDNKLYVLDITCTHLGCELSFNDEDKTWDCPCHASRFDYKGNVLNGPAIHPLKHYKEGNNEIDPKL